MRRGCCLLRHKAQGEGGSWNHKRKRGASESGFGHWYVNVEQYLYLGVTQNKEGGVCENWGCCVCGWDDNILNRTMTSGSSKHPHSVSCYRASNPSNLQQQQPQQAVFGAQLPYRGNHVNPNQRQGGHDNNLMPRIQTSSRHCFLRAVAYARTVEVVVVD
ncbi:hypothetical protein VNO77_40694 [Canavalia gladiata]|uniref:Uncharacterized protein n=1 Tax=Canavalia gladiata TaxID=3824 RepID=A0AAN9PS28_CANGL